MEERVPKKNFLVLTYLQDAAPVRRLMVPFPRRLPPKLGCFLAEKGVFFGR
jgi:hypothetical protein